MRRPRCSCSCSSGPRGTNCRRSTPTGSIHGTVLDLSGARVPQASIVVVNSGTGVRYSATSDSEGHFTLDLLSPGDYSARVEATGMLPQVTPQLHVDVGGGADVGTTGLMPAATPAVVLVCGKAKALTQSSQKLAKFREGAS